MKKKTEKIYTARELEKFGYWMLGLGISMSLFSLFTDDKNIEIPLIFLSTALMGSTEMFLASDEKRKEECQKILVKGFKTSNHGFRKK